MHSEHDDLHEIKQYLQILSAQYNEKRNPVDSTVMASATQPWFVDYRNRKHVFLWLPTAQTLSFEDYGSGPVQAQVWINLGLPQGTRMLIPSSTSLVEFMLRCTDESIP